MKRIKQLIKDHKSIWHVRKDYYIKWNIKCVHRDIPLCSFFLLPAIVYNTYPYRRPDTPIFEVLFLHWYIYIGEWCRKEKTNV